MPALVSGFLSRYKQAVLPTIHRGRVPVMELGASLNAKLSKSVTVISNLGEIKAKYGLTLRSQYEMVERTKDQC